MGERIAIKYYDAEPPATAVQRLSWAEFYAGLNSLACGQWRAFEIPAKAYNRWDHACRAFVRKHYTPLNIELQIMVDTSQRTEQGIVIVYLKKVRNGKESDETVS